MLENQNNNYNNNAPFRLLSFLGQLPFQAVPPCLFCCRPFLSWHATRSFPPPAPTTYCEAEEVACCTGVNTGARGVDGCTRLVVRGGRRQSFLARCRRQHTPRGRCKTFSSSSTPTTVGPLLFRATPWPQTGERGGYRRCCWKSVVVAVIAEVHHQHHG